ncbi:hypothetical protein C8039_14970 [Halogeometricum sp. wsp3]|nr:hypothetical protein C8039_14970 [Halogeometricum sp. wsp3]
MRQCGDDGRVNATGERDENTVSLFEDARAAAAFSERRLEFLSRVERIYAFAFDVRRPSRAVSTAHSAAGAAGNG